MEEVVAILQKRTQNMDPVFFRLIVAYFFSKVASMMRVNVQIADSQVLPVNMYVINLAPSGSGKGHSINIIEDNIIAPFRTTFMNEVFIKKAEQNIARIAKRRATRNETVPEDELAAAMREFEDLGELPFSFDSATGPALKQMRTKLLMAGAGSMNLEIDEIGSNLLGNMEPLNMYLELFDAGKIKPKLIKNTNENRRSEDLVGITPANLCMFGTPPKLLDGGKTEQEFDGFLETGYARRCFFGFSRRRATQAKQTAQDLYDIYNDPKSSSKLQVLGAHIERLAKVSGFGRTMTMPKDVSLALFEYRLWCQEQADEMPEHFEVRKAEMAHRYFKVAKLAAVYSYIDGMSEVTMDSLENAIAMSEMSGQAFEQILHRERPHAKLAQYIASNPGALTEADLIEDLPYYKGSKQHLQQMMTYAVAHGYREGIYIKEEVIDDIKFYSGEMVPETDTDRILVAYSTDIAQGYDYKRIKFDQIHKLTQAPGRHWITHAVRGGHRREENVVEGCNLVVLDIDDSVSIDMAKSLLKNYRFHLYTTKRHTAQNHRFRIVMPLSHEVSLDASDFKQFMNNIFDWLPFEVDRQTGQRARKWLSHKGNYWYNEGDLLPALHFVPNTKKAEQQRARINEQTNLSALERWYVNNADIKGRNNVLMKYAYALVDAKKTLPEIQDHVLKLNRKFPDPLDEAEVLSTVMVTASTELSKRGN
jgi:hypothetical protein